MIDQVDPSSLRTVVLRKRTGQPTFGLYLADDYPQGVYILTIEENSAAAEAKIQPGDRLLAVNGQWVRYMLNNPKEKILQVATRSQSLTVTIQPSDILQWFQLLNEPTRPPPKVYIERTIYVGGDFERYVKSLLTEEIAQFADDDRHSNRRRRRSRRSQHTQTDADWTENRFEAILPETPTQRLIPSMGTPHVMLRQSQSSGRNQTAETPSRSVNRDDDEEKSVSSVQSISRDRRRQICLNRSADFQGFGFHVDSKNRRHVVYRLEPNSPAASSGLRVNDVILQVNEQSTENMPTSVFVDLIKRSRTIHLVVEKVSDRPTTKSDEPPRPTSNSKFLLKRTLSRLKSRSSQENR